MTTQLLKTKLHVPQVPEDFVPRAGLNDNMSREYRRPVSLVSAPVGYGKSTMVAHWVQSREEPTAWVSLDESDSDLRVFLQYVVAAIHTAHPNVCPDTSSLLRAADLPPISVLATSLINELDEFDEPLILVLDDFHCITEPGVHELVTQLLRHPPLLFHLVLITRRDPPLPLTSLRAQGWVTDIRVPDLQFTESETKLFLEQSTGVSVSGAALTNVQQVLEGWPAGLRLIALVLRRQEDPTGFLADLKGGTPQVQVYLMQEVLGRQSPEEREWLLKTSILDRFCAESCDAVCAAGNGTENTTLDGQSFVPWLEQAGMFVICLDPVHGWFRYHPLFQNLLLQEAERHYGRDGLAGLHVEASKWYEAEGLIDEALKHSLATGEVERAAQMVERNLQSVLEVDQWYVLERWLSRLPDAVVQQRVDLLLARAWVLYFRSKYEDILPILDLAESLLPDGTEQQLRHGELAFFHGALCLFQGDGPASLKYLENAIERFPASYALRRGEARVFFGLAVQMVAGNEQATSALDDLVNSDPPPHQRTGAALLAACVYVRLISGDLEHALSDARRFRDAAVERDTVHLKGWADYLWGLVHLHRHELDAAIQRLSRAVELRYSFDTRAALDAVVSLIVAHQARGRPEEARATLQLLLEYAASLDDPEYSALADSAVARLAILQGRTEAANAWLRAKPPPPGEVMLFWLEIPCVTHCRALIAEGSAASLAQAEEQLRGYAEQNEAHHNTCQLIGILSLLAIACAKQGNAHEARTALERAVTLAEPGGFVRPFVELGAPMAELLRQLPGSVAPDHVSKLLAAFEPELRDAAPSAPSSAPVAHRRPRTPYGVEALTNREVEVLELLAQRLYNKEIAVKLSVSTDTVKAHLKSIYRKLQVDTRRQAAIRAEQLGVLEAH